MSTPFSPYLNPQDSNGSNTANNSDPAAAKTRFAINGFGRIGRIALRVWFENYRQQAELVAINTSGSMEVEDWAYLLKYDSDYGVWPYEVKVDRYRTTKEKDDEFPEIGIFTLTDPDNGEEHVITVTAQRDPAKIPWQRYGVNTVIESTGVFRTAEKASAHYQGGAKHVVLSAPGKSEGISTTVLGVETVEDILNKPFVANPQDPAKNNGHTMISNASCTTNCVAPVAAVMQETFGVQKALLTTVHAYTDDQNLKDNSHSKLTRARAAAQNIVPTTTGAAKATALVVPELEGIFDGFALRVPVSVGSISDMTFLLKRQTTVEEINQALSQAAQSERFRGILAVTKEPLVSSDIVGRSESSIVDLNQTQVIGGDLVKVVSWYDNEWGYSNRLVQLAALVGSIE